MDNIPDLTGKLAIITGANSGIGFEASRAMVTHGAQVILACRDIEKGEVAAQQIRSEISEAKLEVKTLDVADLASVRAFADAFTSKSVSLNILCNNAGVMMVPERVETKDGFELQFGTNHLGHFALTGLLLQVMKDTPGARIVTISSMGHRQGKIEFDNLNAELSYKRGGAYALSKLANLLFTYELQRRLESAGSDLIAVAAHPGWTATNLQRYVWLFRFLNNILAQKPEMGVLPLLYAATAQDVRSGDYFGPDGFMEIRGYSKKVPSSKTSYDETLAKRLWEVSEEMTGVKYVF